MNAHKLVRRIDPITLEVIRNKLDGIANEMEWTLLSASFSPIVKEGIDASASLFTADAQTIAQATAIPVHLCSLIPCVENVLRVYPRESMRDGDVYVMNDPYAGGTHAPDIAVVMPIFSGDSIVAFSASMTHHGDVGGATPGSLPPKATDVFQEGLLLPALRLVRDGVYDDGLIRLMRTNVRMPDDFIGDLNAQIAACRVGARRIAEMLTGMSAEEFREACSTLLDHSERLTRAALARIPEGTYRSYDFLDNDGIDLDTRLRVEVAVTIGGGKMHVDMTGTHPQVKGPVNSVPSGAMAAAYFAVRALTDPSIPTNGGCFRPVSLFLPSGSLLNPDRPTPVNGRAHTIKAVAANIVAALAPAVPDRVAAFNASLHFIAFAGTRPNGAPYLVSELVSGGLGAHSRGDGNPVMEGDISNGMNMPIEALELDCPVRMIRSELRADSGGAGRYRGGLGYDREYEFLEDDITLIHRGNHHYTRPRGILGGQPGMSASSSILRRDGTLEKVPGKLATVVHKGDRLRLASAGGGGYGPPDARSQESIEQDLREEKCTPAFTRQTYGMPEN